MNETEKQFSNYFVTYYFYDGPTQFNGRSEFISIEKGIRAEKLGKLITDKIHKRATIKMKQSKVDSVGITSIQYLGDV